MASREGFGYYSKVVDLGGKVGKIAPICVKYRDHVLFKNCDPAEIRPCVREVIGWLVAENSEALLIVVDRPVTPLAHEKITSSGLVVLKDNIIEMHKVRIKKPFNRSRICRSGHKKP